MVLGLPYLATGCAYAVHTTYGMMADVQPSCRGRLVRFRILLTRLIVGWRALDAMPRQAYKLRAGRLLLRCTVMLFLATSCSEISPAPSRPPTPTPIVFTPLGDAMARRLPAAGADIT